MRIAWVAWIEAELHFNGIRQPVTVVVEIESVRRSVGVGVEVRESLEHHDRVVGQAGPPLPPRAPELNPVENIWQFMRDNWLSNRIFKSYDEIVAICCQAWNKLINQPWKIMSIGLRKWAHGF